MDNNTVLIHHIRSGDEQAFEQLNQKYKGLVRAQIKQWVHNADDIKEIEQDIWIKVYCNLASLRTPETLIAWLCQIARNECHSWHRRRHKHISPLPDQLYDTSDPIDEHLIWQESYHNLLCVLDTLSVMDRDLLKAHYLDELSYLELQARFQLSYKAVTMRIIRAKERLRNRLQKQSTIHLSPQTLQGDSQMTTSNAHPDLFPAKQDGKWGYIDRTGKMTILPQYDRALGFVEGLARVVANNKAGFINGNGETVIPLQFDFAYAFSEGLAVVKVRDKHGYIDKTGEMVIEPTFDQAEAFREGFAAIQINDKWGYINKAGSIIVQPEFDQAFPFFKSLGTVLKGRSYIYFNTKGETIWWPKEQPA